MIKKLMVLVIIFIVSNGSSYRPDLSYRIEVELPQLNLEEHYLDIKIMNSMFEKVAEKHFVSRSTTFRYLPKVGDRLNTVVFIRTADGSWSPQLIKMKIFYKNALIYKYWSYTGHVSSEYFKVKH